MSTLTEWFRANAHTLDTLDPDGPLDELEPVREIIGDAAVVALGEGAHFVAEFDTPRIRLLRFLVERCGFTMLAAEYGFATGFAADAWAHGEGEADDLTAIGGQLATWINGGLLRWLREHNAHAERPIEFAGVDLPTSSALRTVLEPVEAYLGQADPESLPRLRTALAFADRIGGGSAVSATTGWGQLSEAEQDALTATLSRLLLRFRALEPRSIERTDQAAYDLAARHLEAACALDYTYSAMHGVFTENPMPGDTGVRDRYLAESVLWHLDRQLDHAGPDARILLVAHNFHIQKTPVLHEGFFSALPMGHFLADALGDQYRAIALTHTGDSVPEMTVGEGEDEIGFSAAATEIGAPAEGTLEAELCTAGLGSSITLTDLRGLPEPIGRLRAQSTVTEAPVPAAFDAVLSTPGASLNRWPL
ncbi:erythromycin esterase family protein [Sciscionella sediminilitoris]|uniref:erythromycin esterase family protein n=1 Tax=Sciscionella sediminilitoris TaxID=1445613 RepID=UPI0004DF9437|nr:erythromycin esterase family protein [Sciscionella sp. SE31]